MTFDAKDIVDRLCDIGGELHVLNACWDAAIEIERLRAENQSLRTAGGALFRLLGEDHRAAHCEDDCPSREALDQWLTTVWKRKP